MPMLLALNGADFGDFGAASSSVLALQSALVTLGKGIGDNILSKIVMDGLIGPNTTEATNRALTVHIGSGQAAATIRTGKLTQAQVVAQAITITNILNTEASRRGFTVAAVPKVAAKTTALVKTTPTPVTYTPPTGYTPPTAYTPPVAVAPPSGQNYIVPPADDTMTIVKYGAAGFGLVALLGAVYWYVTRDKPAIAGLGCGGCGLGASGEARLNNRERELWVNNDEGLYNWFKRERGSMQDFIKRNRAMIDAAIKGVRDAPPRRSGGFGAASSYARKSKRS
jgi:hypothetical protein